MENMDFYNQKAPGADLITPTMINLPNWAIDVIWKFFNEIKKNSFQKYGKIYHYNNLETYIHISE